ncbi:transglutaminase-like domain-containing protein [Roseinatronobacter alkalisoli]|uniref:Transglutaminase family protein n=1 Tax=Roseinatronobacter alkalisoli TaxID=3028235 RepID=A0ABT5TAR0_9RHOB|nr:transglutaminase family protein [Roseinatronobacter sp. HJB301]MDD7972192.1 transglutaminase family protein [Roseinatronobacter sp. HJB301]
MLISLGCRMSFRFPQPTPLIAMLNVHYTRFNDMIQQDDLVADPSIPLAGYRDGFGNWCTRMLAPAGDFTLSANGVFHDSGLPDPVAPSARQHAVQDLPFDTLVYLLGSRYCDTDLLSEQAWQVFGQGNAGWARVQAICDFVQAKVSFGYQHARSTRTASQTLAEGVGVCRDFAHLAITLCRCMNIPARYCTGYLSDIGEPLPHPAGDFAAWMEVYLDGEWHMFDPRNNARRFARFLVARGRDAADVPLTQTFGPATMTGFVVWTEEARQEEKRLLTGQEAVP